MSDEQEPETGDRQVPEGMRDALDAVLRDAARAEEQRKCAPQRTHPPEQGRLGDRLPQFRDISEKLAEKNRNSANHRGETL